MKNRHIFLPLMLSVFLLVASSEAYAFEEDFNIVKPSMTEVTAATKTFFTHRFKNLPVRLKCHYITSFWKPKGPKLPECYAIVADQKFYCSYWTDTGGHAIDRLLCGLEAKDGDSGGNIWEISTKGTLVQYTHGDEETGLSDDTRDRLTRAADDLLNQQHEQAQENAHWGHHH